MPAPRREIKLKSIWDEALVAEVLPNKLHSSKLWKYLIQHPEAELHELPLQSWNFPAPVCLLYD
jgi:hypothetical protein